MARTVLVNDDHATAKAFGNTDERGPYRFYYCQLLYELLKFSRQGIFKHDRYEPDDTVTIDRIVDDLFICGNVESIFDQLLAFRETTCPFGELIIAVMAWVDEDLT